MAEYRADLVYEVECPSPKCPKPDKVVRAGWHNDFQRYLCKTCGKKFAAEGKALRKKYPADLVADAVDAYLSGLSYKQAAENLEHKNDGIEPSKSTVHDWVKGYSALALRYMEGVVGDDGTAATATGEPVLAHVGGHWVADELVLDVGGEEMWCWSVMDVDTRYVLAVSLSPTRDVDDARRVFLRAKRAADRAPAKITTDGLGSYVDAVRAVFPRAEHEVSQSFVSGITNNYAERLMGSFRQRTKTMRGLEARRSGQMYLDAWVLDYNHFKKHEAHRNRTPAEAAGVAARVPWRSWKDVAKLGGEVAERKIQSNVTRKKKPGPKPRANRPDDSDLEGIKEEIQRQLDRQESERARAARRGKKSPVVAPYVHAKRRHGGERGVGGRGRNGMRM